MACKPGDLVLIPFPFSDLQSTKKRPVMVLQGLCSDIGYARK